MKNLDKQHQRRPENPSSGSTSNDDRRRTKLQPLGKEKYKSKQVYLQDDDDDTEIDLFGYLEDDDDEENDDGDEEE